MNRCLALSLAAMLAAQPALAADEQTPPDLVAMKRACRANAFVADQDIAGVAVRKGPGTNFARIATLPAMRMNKDGLELYGADVSVIGTDGHGWFLIEGAAYAPEDDAEGPARTVQTFGKTGQVYAGKGWVHGSRLMTEIVASTGFRAGPEAEAGITIPFAFAADDDEIDATLLDCNGMSLRLRAHFPNRTLDGWINPEIPGEKICASQRTTCN